MCIRTKYLLKQMVFFLFYFQPTELYVSIFNIHIYVFVYVMYEIVFSFAYMYIVYCIYAYVYVLYSKCLK